MRLLLHGETGSNAADVNDDGYVSPLDALHIINDLNSTGARPLPKSKTASTLFVDVSGDNFISSLDVLTVIDAVFGDDTEFGASVCRRTYT
ncbi:MAG: dockerin type I domain-containing protein [Pirellulaceae bacterium]